MGSCEDTFVSLPTGNGKSLIYQLAPSVSKHLSEAPIVPVISLLNALIDDQIASVTKLGITACKLDASSLEHTVSLAGHEILFTSPEVLETSYYRHVTHKFHGNRIFISRMLNRNPKRLSTEVFSSAQKQPKQNASSQNCEENGSTTLRNTREKPLLAGYPCI